MKNSIKIKCNVSKTRTFSHYLIFSLLFSLTLISSCGKKIIEYANIVGEFYFVNQTGYTINVVNLQHEFNVPVDKVNLITHSQGGSKDVNAFSFSDPFTYGMAPNDKKILIKIGNKCENVV